LGHDLRLEGENLPIEGQGFEGPVGGMEKGSAGGLVDPAGLHPHEPALHQVDPANSMDGPESVGLFHDFER
jgi:hypothetical protein